MRFFWQSYFKIRIEIKRIILLTLFFSLSTSLFSQSEDSCYRRVNQIIFKTLESNIDSAKFDGFMSSNHKIVLELIVLKDGSIKECSILLSDYFDFIEIKALNNAFESEDLTCLFEIGFDVNRQIVVNDEIKFTYIFKPR
jgi:hypothetical protein